MRLDLKNSCTVETAEKLRCVLLEALVSDQETTLDFSGVMEADMSLFQLLVSAQRTFERAGKTLIFTATLPLALAEKARLAGFGSLAEVPGERPRETTS